MCKKCDNKLILDFPEVIVVKKILEKMMREDKLYEDEQKLGEKIAKYLNEQEGKF